MGTKEKLVERFKRKPSDFTFQEVERLLLKDLMEAGYIEL